MPDATAIRTAVAAALAEIAPEVDLDDCDPARPLAAELDLDSMDLLSLSTALAERLGVEADVAPDWSLDRLVGHLADAQGSDAAPHTSR